MALRDRVQSAVDADRLFISQHARDRMRQRHIPLWQLISSLPTGTLLAERPDDLPHPAVEIEQLLPDGTSVKVVWSYDFSEDEARLVTVHYFDR